MIGNLQALRAAAALGVVFYHTAYEILGVHTDFGGVATFFVISGFIMCFITATDPSRFMERRLVRIMPMWLICLLVGTVLFQIPSLDTWIWLLQSAFLIPTERGLGVGWTLNLEIYFYALFAVALAINVRLAPLLTALMLVAVFAASWLFPGSSLLAHYSHFDVRYFLCGIALYYVWRSTPPFPLPAWAAIAGVLGIYGWIVIGQAVAPENRALFATPVAIAWLALVAAKCGRDISWPPLLLLGDASYAIYLTHPTVLELFYRHGVPRGQPSSTLIGSIAMMAACVAVGIAVHLVVEKPVDRAIKRWLAYRRSEHSAPRVAVTEQREIDAGTGARVAADLR